MANVMFLAEFSIKAFDDLKVFVHARFFNSFEHGGLLLGHLKYRNLKISKKHLCALDG